MSGRGCTSRLSSRNPVHTLLRTTEPGTHHSLLRTTEPSLRPSSRSAANRNPNPVPGARLTVTLTQFRNPNPVPGARLPARCARGPQPAHGPGVSHQVNWQYCWYLLRPLPVYCRRLPSLPKVAQQVLLLAPLPTNDLGFRSRQSGSPGSFFEAPASPGPRVPLLTAHCSLLLLLALTAVRCAPSLGLMAARGVEYLHQVRVREQRGAVGAEWGETRTRPLWWNGRLLPHQTPWACTCLCPHCAPTAPSLAPSLPPHCLS